MDNNDDDQISMFLLSNYRIHLCSYVCMWMNTPSGPNHSLLVSVLFSELYNELCNAVRGMVVVENVYGTDLFKNWPFLQAATRSHWLTDLACLWNTHGRWEGCSIETMRNSSNIYPLHATLLTVTNTGMYALLEQQLLYTCTCDMCLSS